MPGVLPSALAVLAAIAGTVLVIFVASRVLRYAGRRSDFVRQFTDQAYRPAALMGALLAARLAIPVFTEDGWHDAAIRVTTLAVIACAGWLAIALLNVTADLVLQRFRLDEGHNLTARRLHTQITILRRVGIALITILTIGAMLITFPQARAVGASVFASAGLVGIVAALAAQSTLGNFFAGMQLAFGNALHLDDVVVVEGEWGRVEEMTLSYVVVKIWDERRLILPSSYFTATPFENWTRRSSSVLGTVEVDVDWSIPIQPMRKALSEIVEGQRDGLWDGRLGKLQVTDSTGGNVRIRALVSAANSSNLWDLRCLVREQLVEWVQMHHPESRPKARAEVSTDQTATEASLSEIPWSESKIT